MASSSELGSKAEGEAAEAQLVCAEEQHNFSIGLKKARKERGSTAKERISKMPPCAAGKRSSIYRGVTRHRWTGRYEAHLWDKSTWNENQNKKGKQVYLGAYDDEEAAARAYDLAALKYWGPGTLINFPVSDYSRDIEEMQMVSREDYLASLRRKSSGFSRGVSKYRGISRQSQNNRWETSFGRILGNEYITNCSTSEDVAAESEYGGSFGLGRKIDLTCYITWWVPNKIHRADSLSRTSEESHSILKEPRHSEWPCQPTEPYQLPTLGLSNKGKPFASSVSACSILSQSTVFKVMQEKATETQNKLQEDKIIFEKTVPKLTTVGGSSNKVGDGLGSSGLPLQRTPYPFASSLLSAPLMTNCSTVDPFPDSVFWTSLVPAPGLSMTPTLRKGDLSSACTFYDQD